MDAKDIRNIQEAYMEVYASQEELDEGMTMKDFKANRQKNKRRAASTDAAKRGHVGKEWYNSGRKYSPDEAKRSRANMDDEERRTRHRSAVDPDNEDDNNYSADKTKNPKKLRKQRAMGEIGEQVDIYDIILSHLLDEGYAETVEAAEVIMVNMSEDWRENILEMDDFAAGGGNAKMKKTGMTKDQVVALGKKNLANVAKKPTSQQPQKSSQQSEKPKVAHGQLISKPGQPKRYADSGTVTARHKFHTYNDSMARAQDVASWTGDKDKAKIKKWADTNYRQNIAMDTDDQKYDPTKTSYPEFKTTKRSARQSWDKL